MDERMVHTGRLCRASALSAGLVVCLLAAEPLRGQRMAVERFTVEDGLAGDLVNDIYQDRAGFLWIATGTGLSRFDGRRFVNYGTRHGLPHPEVRVVLQTSDGALWVGTDAGLARLEPRRATETNRFTVWRFGPDPGYGVQALHEDSRGRLWAAAGPLLMRSRRDGESTRFERVPFRVPFSSRFNAVLTILEGPRGELWVGTSQGLVRLRPDGTQHLYALADPETVRRTGADPAQTAGFDPAGNLWVEAYGTGIFAFRPETAPARDEVTVPFYRRARRDRSPECRVRSEGEVCLYDVPHPLAVTRTLNVIAGSRGRLWFQGERGLVRYEGDRFETVALDPGLTRDPHYSSFLRDAAGNLWMGSLSLGLLRLLPDGFTRYGEAEGLRGIDIAQLLESDRGQLIAYSRAAGGALLCGRSGSRFSCVRPHGVAENWGGWAFRQYVLQDSHGAWWIPTATDGLYRYPAVEAVEELATTPPLAHYTTADGLPSNGLWRLYGDRAGDLWLGLFGAGEILGVFVRERASGRFRPIGPDGGLPAPERTGPPNAFAEDAAGRLWIGFYEGGLARSTDASHRRFEFFGEAAGVPTSFVTDLFVDSHDRLWIATSVAVLRVDDPGAAIPVFEHLSAADGLSAEGACCFAEDAQGRVYVGHRLGVDRLDPRSGRARHFTVADGLPSHYSRSLHTDRHGAIWVGTRRGLARLPVVPDTPLRPPPVRIGGVRVGGLPWPVPDLGATRLAGLTLRPREKRLRVTYFGIGLLPSEELRYQYRLRGEDAAWSEPRRERSVTFAAVPAGAHTFEVRAVRDDGTVSAVPATLAFRRQAPLVERAWFRALMLAAVALAIWAVARLRARRRAALAGERRRIAQDLHDELGSGLARMSILSEVARREIAADPERAARVLSRIGEGSRQMTDAAADLVWSLDSDEEGLDGLLRRLREFAGDALSGAGIAWSIEAPASVDGLRLGPRRQRQLLLLMKEAMHNVVRHAGARRVELGLAAENGALRAWVRDDGRGFDPETRAGSAGSGLGLASMERRARRLGGTLELESAVGAGTVVRVHLPLAPSAGRLAAHFR